MKADVCNGKVENTRKTISYLYWTVSSICFSTSKTFLETSTCSEKLALKQQTSAGGMLSIEIEMITSDGQLQ